jgi:NTE family protein
MTEVNLKIDNKINAILGKSTNSSSNTKNILILSGGGIKGIAHIGALKALEEKNILQNITTIAGTSIGGLIASLIVIGYTADELYSFIQLFDLSKIKSINPSKLLTKHGLDDGSKLIFVLETMFEGKNISKHITFLELWNKTKIKLILTTACLNDKQPYYLSHITYPTMPIIFAIRMTTSLPIWFIPVEYNNKLFVDGGCIDNYPIQLFEKNLDNVIGIYLSENREYCENILNTEDFLINLMQCFFEGNACNSIKGFEKYTIKLNLPPINIIDLNINQIFKKRLFDFGYLETINFF